MSPLIKDRATLHVQPRAIYLPGDILTFLDRRGRLTTHRLLGIFPRNGKLHCLTRPDNHEHPDAAFPLSRVLGRVTGGECHPDAIRIPWRIRLNALSRFTVHILRRLFPL
ncbi:S24/S26 family peptidase [Thiolapillus sp.]